MPTPATQEALDILRDGSRFQWYVIPLLAFVTYVYAHELEARNLRAVFAGLAFWGMDWINETANALVLHFSGYAPVCLPGVVLRPRHGQYAAAGAVRRRLAGVQRGRPRRVWGFARLDLRRRVDA